MLVGQLFLGPPPSSLLTKFRHCYLANLVFGASIYNVRNIFGFWDPLPPCHVQNSRNLGSFVCFLGTPHPLSPTVDVICV